MHQSQEHIILQHTLQTLWQHVFKPCQFFFLVFFLLLFWLLSLSLWMYLPSPTLTPPTGDGRAIKSLVPGLLLSKGCGYRKVCVGVV